MIEPMKPELARNLLVTARENNIDIHSDFHHALETIAGMTVEEDWRLVDPFTNGGAYETRRYTRMVSEWNKDE